MQDVDEGVMREWVGAKWCWARVGEQGKERGGREITAGK